MHDVSGLTADQALSAVKSLYGDEGHFNYNFHISRAPAFVYVNNPKCGCTTAKASLNRWSAAHYGRTLDYASMGDIHDRNTNPLLSPRQLGREAAALILTDPGMFRFTILRDPVSRLASAYASKLAWNSSERQALNNGAGRPADAEVPFALFVELIHADNTLRDINEHWRLQTRQTAAAFIKYDAFCLQDSLNEDLLGIRNHLFPSVALDVFEARSHFPGNRSNGAASIAAASPDMIKRIEKTYAEDYDFYHSARPRRGSLLTPA